MLKLLFAPGSSTQSDYEAPLIDALAEKGIAAQLRPDFAPDEVDYIIYEPNSPLKDFGPFTRTKAVLNLWAGVEAIVGNPTLKLPLCRMVDPAMTQGMVEYVTAHVMRHHLGMDAHILAAPGEWVPKVPSIAWDRNVTMLGLGELGAAAARQLAQIGFRVSGWSRSQKSVEGVTCHSGAEGLEASLKGAEIVVLLLPRTHATENTLNARTLGLLEKGAVIINPGRGPLIDDEALIDALNSGQVGHATLDVFRQEPLPKEHAYWHHKQVTVTPHVASHTRPKWAARGLAENICRYESGEPLIGLVDLERGY